VISGSRADVFAGKVYSVRRFSFDSDEGFVSAAYVLRPGSERLVADRERWAVGREAPNAAFIADKL
jgi:hypothetical protein